MAHHRLHRGGQGAARVVAGLCFALLLTAAAPAQPPLEPPASAESRDRQYAELDKEVAALERQGNLLKKVVRLVKPTVVHIEVEKTERSELSYRSRSVEEAGSGVVIEHQQHYYVLTNRHVIKNATLENIKIHLADGQTFHPTSVLADPNTDVAVMSISASNLVPARLGDSDNIDIGDFVLAVGSPFGLSHSVTYGIISAKGRRDLQLGVEGVQFQDFMQTDAAINPGNSGGPLLNLRGEVVGINTAIASSGGGNEGIGFTIPINMAIHVARQLIEQGAFERAFLGVLLDSEFQPETGVEMGLPRAGGARVKDVTPQSPAAQANIQSGDVILWFDNLLIEDDNHLINTVGLTPIGKQVQIVLYRDGKRMTVAVTVGSRQAYQQN